MFAQSLTHTRDLIELRLYHACMCITSLTHVTRLGQLCLTHTIHMSISFPCVRRDPDAHAYQWNCKPPVEVRSILPPPKSKSRRINDKAIHICIKCVMETCLSHVTKICTYVSYVLCKLACVMLPPPQTLQHCEVAKTTKYHT